MNPTVIFTIIFTVILLIYMALDNPHETLDQDIKLYEKQHFIIELIDSVSIASSGIAIGFLCLFLSWNVNYFNWLHVGDFPSTPLTPSPRSRAKRHSPADLMHPTGSNAELAYFTPILVSVAAAGIMVWNSLDG